MDTINMSTGFSPFELLMDQSLCLIPPLMPCISTNPEGNEGSLAALALIKHLHLVIAEAQDNLLAAKVAQSEFTN
jgi:hypothetical protein